jgi:hypothetical protein
MKRRERQVRLVEIKDNGLDPVGCEIDIASLKLYEVLEFDACRICNEHDFNGLGATLPRRIVFSCVGVK